MWENNAYVLLLILISVVMKVWSQCSGDTLTIPVGYEPVTIFPPGYPTGYAINLHCAWLGSSSITGAVLLIRVTDITLNCAGDAVNVYDGTTNSDTSIHTNECQSDTGPRTLSYRVTTTGNVYTEFSSDSSTSASEKGYLMYAVSGKDLSGTGCTTPQELTASTTEQFLTSPGFPNVYPTDQTCTWVITSQLNKHMYVEIRFMDIENHATCNYDYLEFTESGSGTTKLCNTDWWNVSYNYTEIKNITVKFHSDNNLGKRGFLIAYWETETDSTTDFGTDDQITTKEKETSTNGETGETTAKTVTTTNIKTEEQTTTKESITKLATETEETTSKDIMVTSQHSNNDDNDQTVIVVVLVVVVGGGGGGVIGGRVFIKIRLNKKLKSKDIQQSDTKGQNKIHRNKSSIGSRNQISPIPQVLSTNMPTCSVPPNKTSI